MNYKNVCISLAGLVLYCMAADSALEKVGFVGVFFVALIYFISLVKTDYEARSRP